MRQPKTSSKALVDPRAPPKQAPTGVLVLLLDDKVRRLVHPRHLAGAPLGAADLVAAMPHVLAEVHEARALLEVEGLDIDDHALGLAQCVVHGPLALLDLVADLQDRAQGRRHLKVDPDRQVAPICKKATAPASESPSRIGVYNVSSITSTLSARAIAIVNIPKSATSNGTLYVVQAILSASMAHGSMPTL
eukprot:CAMPEP_0183419570 /NCGR_PEP_ID=MMETSP0370-20130417/25881_1 /TAXON_ID=268820 /ORGANISM="Peridinium aciculiferum, Strain PAER-2" /LENGTH=190 /DNA_ID=CAMNT_0025603385 /DNA_START=272 /DNA_END=846 /DNA_ORIENTATION=-